MKFKNKKGGRRRGKKVQRTDETSNLKSKKVVEFNSTIFITALNVNNPNISIKRQGLSNWIKNEDYTMCYLQEIHFNCRHEQVKVKGWKKLYYANVSIKKS